MSYKFKRKIVKITGKLIQTSSSTGQPNVPFGLHLVRRSKIGNPFASHFGILISLNGFPIAFDLQQDVGPRRVSYSEFADGKAVFIMKSLVGRSGIDAAIARLDDAIENMSVWRFFDNNCEHFGMYVMNGEKKSGQIDGLKWAAALLVIWRFFG